MSPPSPQRMKHMRQWAQCGQGRRQRKSRDMPEHRPADASPTVPGGTGLSHLQPEPAFAEDQLGVSGA